MLGAVLVRDVKPEFWYMEIVDIIRRLMLTCMPVAFSQSGYGKMITFSLVIALLALVVQYEFQPYKLDAMNTVKALEAWQNLLSIIVLLIQDADMFKDADMYNLAGVGLVFVDFLMVAIMVWSAWNRGACLVGSLSEAEAEGDDTYTDVPAGSTVDPGNERGRASS